MRTLMLVAGCAVVIAWTIAGSALATDEAVSETAPAATASAMQDDAAMPQDPAAPASDDRAPAEAAPADAMESPPAPADDMTAVSGMEAPADLEAPADMAAATEMEAVATEPKPMVLGDVGYDSEGRPGRIHIVVTGDTLWDISDAYLGTPWVWPSIWKDNRDIENPHRIDPGDHIWITDSEMRVITAEEAEALRAGQPASDSPAAPSDSGFADAGIAPEIGVVSPEQQLRRVSTREWAGLVTPDDLEAAASVVRKISEQDMIAQMDNVYIGVGEGDVEVGDAFDIIRKEAKVKDPESGRFLGWYVNVLGWLEVVEVHAETSRAKIRMSTEDIRVGDRLIPHRPESLDIAIQPSPEDVEGMIAFFPRGRVVIGPLDFVYLNRGSLDGLETGSPLEVVCGGETVSEPVRSSRVEIPPRVVAQLLVVEAQADTAVALVANSETDLVVGDSFRGIRD